MIGRAQKRFFMKLNATTFAVGKWGTNDRILTRTNYPFFVLQIQGIPHFLVLVCFCRNATARMFAAVCLGKCGVYWEIVCGGQKCWFPCVSGGNCGGATKKTIVNLRYTLLSTSVKRKTLSSSIKTPTNNEPLKNVIAKNVRYRQDKGRLILAFP